MMQAKKKRTKKIPEAEKARVSVSFTPESYQKLQELAEKMKVSIAWVVRDAVDKYFDSEK